jgi:ribosomal protein L21
MTNLKDCRTDAKTEKKRVKKEEEKRNGHRQQTYPCTRLLFHEEHAETH